MSEKPEKKEPDNHPKVPAFIITTHDVPKDFTNKPYFVVEAVQYNTPVVVDELGRVLRAPIVAPVVFIEVDATIVLHVCEMIDFPKAKRKFFFLPSNLKRRFEPDYNDFYHGSVKFNDTVYHLYEKFPIIKKSNIIAGKFGVNLDKSKMQGN